MGCCGGTVKHVNQIIQGDIRLITDKAGLTKIPEFTENRIEVCKKCDESTWLFLFEWDKWLLVNGIAVLKNFNQLKKLPKLPKYERDERRQYLYCRLCKCYIKAKARVPAGECSHPEGDKWLLKQL